MRILNFIKDLKKNEMGLIQEVDCHVFLPIPKQFFF